MPYLDEARKKFIDLNPGKTFEPGDWNYLFTLAIIRVWEKTPRYKTIHLLRRACFYHPNHIPEIYAVSQRLLNLNIDTYDIKTARELSFNEFYRRVGAKYEDQKIIENGDVYPKEEGLLKSPIEVTIKKRKK